MHRLHQNMGKLSNLRPSISALPSRLAYTQDASAKEQLTAAPPAWRKWYSLKRWKDLRWSILVRDLFTCAMCGKVETDTSQLHADHISEQLARFPELEVAVQPSLQQARVGGVGLVLSGAER